MVNRIKKKEVYCSPLVVTLFVESNLRDPIEAFSVHSVLHLET